MFWRIQEGQWNGDQRSKSATPPVLAVSRQSKGNSWQDTLTTSVVFESRNPRVPKEAIWRGLIQSVTLHVTSCSKPLCGLRHIFSQSADTISQAHIAMLNPLEKHRGSSFRRCHRYMKDVIRAVGEQVDRYSVRHIVVRSPRTLHVCRMIVRHLLLQPVRHVRLQ